MSYKICQFLTHFQRIYVSDGLINLKTNVKIKSCGVWSLKSSPCCTAQWAKNGKIVQKGIAG